MSGSTTCLYANVCTYSCWFFFIGVICPTFLASQYIRMCGETSSVSLSPVVVHSSSPFDSSSFFFLPTNQSELFLCSFQLPATFLGFSSSCFIDFEVGNLRDFLIICSFVLIIIHYPDFTSAGLACILRTVTLCGCNTLTRCPDEA